LPESTYWKEELTRIAKSIRPVKKPRRWSQRAVSVIERDLTIGCFIVRRMVELHKVSSRVSNLHLNVFSAPAMRPVNKLNSHLIEENYDWKSETKEIKSVLYLCNQCIHAYTSFIERDQDRNWSHLLVASDYDRKDLIWRIPFTSLISAFETAAADWPSTLHMKYDPKITDFKVTTD